MTTQEAFDKVLTEIRGRGYKAAMSPDGLGCVNVDMDGMRCAVALLASSVDNLTLPDYEVMKETGCSQTLIHALRGAHDFSLGKQKSPWAWECQMRDIAKKEDLVYTPPMEPL